MWLSSVFEGFAFLLGDVVDLGSLVVSSEGKCIRGEGSTHSGLIVIVSTPLVHSLRKYTIVSVP